MQQYADAESQREDLLRPCILYWMIYGGALAVGIFVVLLRDAFLGGWLPATIFASALLLIPALIFLAVLAVSLAIVCFPVVSLLVDGRELGQVQRTLCLVALTLGLAAITVICLAPVYGLIAIPLLGFSGLMLAGVALRFIVPVSERDLAGHCRQCGYDLTMNESGRCPECGTPHGGRRSL